MSISRIKRVNELLHREIGAALFRVVGQDEFDVASVTITRVETSRDLRHARVFISIRGEQETRRRVMNSMLEHRRDFQQHIHNHVVLKYTPRLMFEIDESIQQGDHVLDILNRLDIPPEPVEPESDSATESELSD